MLDQSSTHSTRRLTIWRLAPFLVVVAGLSLPRLADGLAAITAVGQNASATFSAPARVAGRDITATVDITFFSEETLSPSEFGLVVTTRNGGASAILLPAVQSTGYLTSREADPNDIGCAEGQFLIGELPLTYSDPASRSATAGYAQVCTDSAELARAIATSAEFELLLTGQVDSDASHEGGSSLALIIIV